MDVAKTLIRSVVRAFYDTPFVLVIDALMVHSALHNEDLSYLLQIPSKELRKLCGKLKEDRLLSVHSRSENRDGQQRPINKDYYYVDFHATIDAIKYRIFRLDQKVKDMYKPSEEKKDFHCPRCKAQWTELEVLDKVGPMGFECHRCGGVLEREEPDAGDSTGHAKQSKLMSQLDGLLKMLQQVDSEDIPTNDFDTAFSLAIPVDRDRRTNPGQQGVPVNPPKPPAAVKGMAQIVAAQLDVSVTTGSERTTAEQATESQRKATIAAQNVLPVWHTTSTVTGETTVVGKKDGEQQANGGALLKEEEDESKISNEDEQMEAYYAEMERERQKEAREQEGEAASEDEEEGDFEDVLGASPNDTPSSSLSGTPKGSQPPQSNGSVKRKGSESGSSAPATNTSTPAGSGPAIEDGDGPVPKKVKFEGAENGAGAVKSEAGEQVDKDSDEDEEADFEDAL